MDEPSLTELASLIYSKQVRDGEWHVIDYASPSRGEIISAMLCDNKHKILELSLRLFEVGMSSAPQNRDLTLVDVIYGLLGFCRAHNINTSQMLTKMVNTDEDV